MRRTILCLAGFTVLGIELPSPAAEPRPYRFFKEVQAKPRDKEELLAVPLDSEIYAATQNGPANIPDIRVYDNAGREISYLLEKVSEKRTETIRRIWAARDIRLKTLDEGGLEIHVARDVKDDPTVDGIRLLTPLRNFEQRVRIFGSEDGKKWEPLAPQAVIFDYSRYMDVANREVPLPANSFKQFRIVIDNVTAEQESQLLELTRRLQGGEENERVERFAIERRPFRIDRIEFWHNVIQEHPRGEKKVEYAFPDYKVEHREKERQTVLHVRTERQPLTALAIRTTSRNFSRRAVVEVPVVQGVRTVWRPVGEATLARIDFRDLQREDLKVEFPEQRHAEYRLIIDNKDSPALELTGVAGEGNEYRLVFLAAPQTSYQVYYGAENIAPPRYDTAALSASLTKGYTPEQASLGAQQNNPLIGEAPISRVRTVLSNPVLWGVIVCLLVAVLAWGLYRAGSRIDALPKDS